MKTRKSRIVKQSQQWQENLKGFYIGIVCIGHCVLLMCLNLIAFKAALWRQASPHGSGIEVVCALLRSGRWRAEWRLFPWLGVNKMCGDIKGCYEAMNCWEHVQYTYLIICCLLALLASSKTRSSCSRSYKCLLFKMQAVEVGSFLRRENRKKSDTHSPWKKR